MLLRDAGIFVRGRSKVVPCSRQRVVFDDINCIVGAVVICQGSLSSRELSNLRVVHVNGKCLGVL